MKISAGIIGVRGYVGQELLSLLLKHPQVSVRYLGSRTLSRPKPIGEISPQFRHTENLQVHPFRLKEAMASCELIFLALPAGVAKALAPRILRKEGMRVIDLSGDFRLKRAGEAVYGLSEWARDLLPGKRLVANPGCYPTAVLLGLLPLSSRGLLKKEGLIVDAKSGTSGAGRSLKEELLFCEVNEDFRAYRVNAHQHIPEMEQALSGSSGKKIRMVFVPHLVPIHRGLLATMYAPLSRPLTAKQLRAIYLDLYGKEPFIHLLPEGQFPQVRSVARTNHCQIGLGLSLSGKLALILSAIDNLGKGAAGQAVQNMNLMFGFPETEGLL